jgi:hypothetical protein
MRHLILAFALSSIVIAQTRPGSARSEDETLVVEATAFPDKEGVVKALGQDPGMEGLVIVQVKVAPRGENNVRISLDDFTLISRKDGQRSQPLAPSQIAGRGALVVDSGRKGGGIGVSNNNRGPMWGGMPGTGTRPRRVGGDGEGGSIQGGSEAAATVDAESRKGENPLLGLLKERVLPEKETNEAVTGLLYFFLEGKHKMKHLELMYKTPASNKLMLDFER